MAALQDKVKVLAGDREGEVGVVVAIGGRSGTLIAEVEFGGDERDRAIFAVDRLEVAGQP